MEFAIPSLDELRAMSLHELELLAHELRARIVSVSARNGGHLGASLGAVEIAIAFHHVFQSPKDLIVWDVGHQAYAHKLLTGRARRFDTLRKRGGISGFLSRNESEHDAFGAGHSSTSLSAALGLSWRNEHDWTVAVIGDGGLTAGLALEALNNFSETAKGPVLIVLNDNQMSISANVGALSSVLMGGDAGTFFSQWGLEYVGPGNGHDLGYLIGTLKAIRDSRPQRPILLHVYTEKGHGYAPAEEQPAHFHGISPIGKVSSAPTSSPKETYSQRFSRRVLHHAEINPKVVAITAAMSEGTGLNEFARKLPDRMVDVGIAEQHAITFAAGLAAGGLKPVAAIYSTFLQRALDSLIHDVSIQNLPVLIGVDRAGLVGQDGATHHGLFDLCYLSMIPGFTVYAPASLKDLDRCVDSAMEAPGPVAIRYPRGAGPETVTEEQGLGLRKILQPDSPQLVVVALGPTLLKAKKAIQTLNNEGFQIALWSTLLAKPIDPGLIQAIEDLPREVAVVSLEDGNVPGGFGSHLRASIGAARVCWEWGYPDRFIEHGTPEEQEEDAAVSAPALEKRLRELLK
jgi:1-deoxy-D-xylulose-5-phosphate synthase